MDAASFSPSRLWKSALWAGIGSGLLLAEWGSGGWLVVGLGLLSGVTALGCAVGTLVGRPNHGALIGAFLAMLAALIGVPAALVVASAAALSWSFLRRR